MPSISSVGRASAIWLPYMLSSWAPLAAQRTGVDDLVTRVNTILQTDAVQDPPPTVSVTGDSVLVFEAGWDSVVTVVRREMHVRDIGAITTRPTTRPREPAYFRLEVIVPCVEERRCVRVLTSGDSVIGVAQRVRLTVWRDAPGAVSLPRALRELVQVLQRQNARPSGAR